MTKELSQELNKKDMNPDQALSRGKLDDFVVTSKELWVIKYAEWLFSRK